MIAMCGNTNKGLEELSREEALDLIYQLMVDCSEVQGQSIKDFAKRYDIYIPNPKDNLTHEMVQRTIQRLYEFGIEHYNLPKGEVLDSGYENELVGWVVIGQFDKWGFQIGYDIDDEVVELDYGWGIKEMPTSQKVGIPIFVQDVKRVAFKV